MTCDQATFMLERRWDKSLSGEEERALDEHIHGCAVCSAEADAIAVADRVFLRLPECRPSIDIAAAVAKRIAEEAPAEPNRMWFWGAIVLIAAAAAAVWRFGVPIPSALVTGWAAGAAHSGGAMAESVLGSWLRPVMAVVRSLEPVAPVALPALAALATAELAVLGRWALRRSGGQRAAGQV